MIKEEVKLLAFQKTNELNKKILELILDKKCSTFIEAVIHSCELLEIEVETAAGMLSLPIKKKIEEEAHKNNFFRGKKSVSVLE